ncbi:hypothetical protein KGV31_002161 [Vibrio parahaemolyticus]|nr:hypothetical protein [Vibrio parahaemolyticus]EHU0344304.1 hypothetical protein [Vibrio parahaemolyticus]EHU0354338.1 hypothetical protein [Vibrio parahaemolyticus]
MYEWKYWVSDFDIEILNVEKNKPDLVDAFGHSITSEYYQGHESAYQYVYNVLSNKRPASKSEIAMCERFCYDLLRDDIRFNTKEIDFAISIVNMLTHPKGKLKGVRMDLMRWMIFLIANMFGWFYTDNAHESLRGSRRFIDNIVFVPRGNAKTTIAAAVVILNSIFTKNGSPIATISATTSSQAGIAFKDISVMINASPSIKKYFKVMQYKIRCLINDGEIFATSKNADAFNGYRISTGVLDEWAAHPNGEITEAIATGTASSIDPIMLYISTAYNNLGYGFEQFNIAKEIAFNNIENDRTFSAVYCADEEDLEDYGSEYVLEKANPSFGHAVIPAALNSAYTKSLTNEAAKANFMIKHLNVFYTFDEAGFVNASDLLACRTHDLDMTKYSNKECYIGLDLASVDDLSSAVLIFPNEESGIDVFHRSYLPETALDNLKPAIRDRYIKAQKDGELVITPTEVTDFNYIKCDILDWTNRFDVQAISIDAAAGGARFAFDMNEEHDLEIAAVKQGFGLSEPSVMFQNLVKDGKVKYNDSLLEWGIVNSLMIEGEYGDVRVTKSKIDPTRKIDPCIAMIIGLSQTILQESNQSIYETQDFRFI